MRRGRGSDGEGYEFASSTSYCFLWPSSSAAGIISADGSGAAATGCAGGGELGFFLCHCGNLEEKACVYSDLL